MEQHFAFIKNNRVTQIAVFASKDEQLADRIATEQGYDDAIWVGQNTPILFSEYDGKKFIAPTFEYLLSIGVANPIVEPIVEETPTE